MSQPRSAPSSNHKVKGDAQDCQEGGSMSLVILTGGWAQVVDAFGAVLVLTSVGQLMNVIPYGGEFVGRQGVC